MSFVAAATASATISSTDFSVFCSGFAAASFSMPARSAANLSSAFELFDLVHYRSAFSLRSQPARSGCDFSAFAAAPSIH